LPLADRLILVAAPFLPPPIDDELVAVDSGGDVQEFVELVRFASRHDQGNHSDSLMSKHHATSPTSSI
jgi:hypothetical protein